MRHLLILSCLVFYVGAVFVFNDHSEHGKNFNGANFGFPEASAKEGDGQFSTGFPESAVYQILPPRRVGDLGFSLDCPGVVIDDRTGAVLFEKDMDKITPIASITKLATALTFLDFGLDWNTVYKIGDRDRVEGGKIYLYRGDEVTLKNLFHLSLVASDNTATKALAYSTGLDVDQFVTRMNLKMKEIGLTKTSFTDPVGISDNNVSTAREVAELAKVAFGRDEIKEVVLTPVYNFKTKQGVEKVVRSTDRLLEDLTDEDIDIHGGKTGFTEAAGYCFVGKFSNPDQRELISVVLGSQSIESRFTETKKLVQEVYGKYEWQ